jgi:hypothetical protein
VLLLLLLEAVADDDQALLEAPLGENPDDIADDSEGRAELDGYADESEGMAEDNPSVDDAIRLLRLSSISAPLEEGKGTREEPVWVALAGKAESEVGSGLNVSEMEKAVPVAVEFQVCSYVDVGAR